MSAGAWPPQAAVVGAGGFVGSHVADALDRSGLTVARFTRDRPCVLPGQGLAAPLRGVPVIYYLATSITPHVAERRPELAAADRDVFRRLMDALAAADRATVVVLSSSGGTVYGGTCVPPYAESAPIAPASAYGEAKARLERDLLERADSLTPVVLRLSNVYGPRQRTDTGQGVVAHWIASLAAGRPVRVLGDPGAVRDYVYVGDVADAMLRVYRCAAGTGQLPRVINVGSGIPTSLAQLLRELESVVDREIRVEYVAGRRFDRRDVWLDVGLAARALGWRARTPIREGLAKTWSGRARALPAA